MPKNSKHWPLLLVLGVPMATSRQLKKKPTRALLLKTIDPALTALLKSKPDQRTIIAVESWLLALQAGFPRFFKSEIKSRLVNRFLPKEITGPHLKLRRIAASILASYL